MARFWCIGTHLSHCNVLKQVWQSESCNDVSDVKMTSPALRGGNTYYIISRSAINLEFSEIKVNSKIRKVQKLETHKFNTIAMIWYFVRLWCDFDVTGRSSVKFGLPQSCSYLSFNRLVLNFCEPKNFSSFFYLYSKSGSFSPSKVGLSSIWYCFLVCTTKMCEDTSLSRFPLIVHVNIHIFFFLVHFFWIL